MDCYEKVIRVCIINITINQILPPEHQDKNPNTSPLTSPITIKQKQKIGDYAQPSPTSQKI